MTKPRLRALVADDDVHIRGLVAQILRLLDVDVVAEAADGEEALIRFQADEPDLIILDVAMPLLSGLDVLEHVHRMAPHVRVVMLTHNDGFESMRRSMGSGVTCYIRKTNTAEQIYRLLAEYLAQPNLTRRGDKNK